MFPGRDCQRGLIEERAKALLVVVFAGNGPATGRRTYLRETVNGTGKAAHERGEKTLNKLLTQAYGQRSAPSAVSPSYALSEWMRTSEIEDSTRHTYQGYIDRTIKPALSETAANKISARMLEGLHREAQDGTATRLRGGEVPSS
ncbi:hypothetical protein [Saccharopolyspora sp. NPDC002376]